jgi:AcrR family transcriptional regulator
MSAAARRAHVLAAATRAFARTGYAGTTTEAVALEAGVSQPYVVRIFGSKLELFLEVFESVTRTVHDRFAEVVDTRSFDPASEDDWRLLNESYLALLADRDALLVMMHGFLAGDVPEIGAQARRTMGDIYEVVLRTGCTEERARDFVAYGMLLNVLVAIGATAPDQRGPLGLLASCAFGEGLDLVR